MHARSTGLILTQLGRNLRVSAQGSLARIAGQIRPLSPLAAPKVDEWNR